MCEPTDEQIALLLADMVSFLCREGATFESHIRQDMNIEHEGRYLTICVLPVRQDGDDTPIWWAWTTEEQYDAMTADSNDKPKGAEFFPWNEAAIEFDKKTSACATDEQPAHETQIDHDHAAVLQACNIVDLSDVDLSDADLPEWLLDGDGKVDGDKASAALAAYRRQWVTVRRVDIEDVLPFIWNDTISDNLKKARPAASRLSDALDTEE